LAIAKPARNSKDRHSLIAERLRRYRNLDKQGFDVVTDLRERTLTLQRGSHGVSDLNWSMQDLRAEECWTTIIGPHKGAFDWKLAELWRSRDLISLFVWRDFVSLYKQTI